MMTVTGGMGDCLGEMLMDTGATRSILPMKKFKPDEDDEGDNWHSPPLVSASGHLIKRAGYKTLTFTIPGMGNRRFTWRFIVAAVDLAIVGGDFFAANRLLVDCDGKRVWNKDELVRRHPSFAMCIMEDQRRREFLDMVTTSKIETVFRPSGVTHAIETTGVPAAERVRRLVGPKLSAAQHDYRKMVAAGQARPSKSPWAAPLVVVPKPEADPPYRTCCDYRRLNSQTVPDAYPMPRCEDVISKVSGSNLFTKLDLEMAYGQIPVRAKDIEKTASVTPMGLFEHPFMMFGMRNSGSTMQRELDDALLPAQRDGVKCGGYTDDIIIGSVGYGNHRRDVRRVLDCLNARGLRLSIGKCSFAQPTIEFLGHTINEKGVKPMESKVAAIQELRPPTNIKGLRGFIGCVGYYHPLIKNLSRILSPLHELVARCEKNKGRRKQLFTLSKLELVAFEEAKEALITATEVAFPDFGKPFQVVCDASDIAVGAVLQQRSSSGIMVPVRFFSRKLNKAERNYGAFDRELLSACLAVKGFAHILDNGIPFQLATDHLPLVNAIPTMKEPSPRQWRLMSFLSQFSFTVVHVPGAQNVVADYLSRHVLGKDDKDYGEDVLETNDDTWGIHALHTRNSEQGLRNEPLTDADMAREQKADPKLLETVSRARGRFTLTTGGVYVDQGGVDGATRVLLPTIYRQLEFQRLHSFSHPGFRPTLRLLQDRYVWDGMRQDIRRWVQECHKCQRAKVHRHTKSSLGVFPTASRFQTVHVDLISVPQNQGCSHVLTMVDQATSWPEAVPMSSVTAEDVAREFNRVWISRFGAPEVVVSDQGRNMDSAVFGRMCQLLGISKHRTTSYHPQANGKNEVWNRAVKTSFRCLGDNASGCWLENLPTVLLGLRNAVGENGYSASQRVYGASSRLPGDYIAGGSRQQPIETVDDFVTKLAGVLRSQQPTIKKAGDRPCYVPKGLSTSTHVWLRNETRRGLMPSYVGPFKVLKREGKTMVLDMLPGSRRVTIDRLKPAFAVSATGGRW